MRAREFIDESRGKTPLRKGFKQASPNTVAYSHLDNNNHPYLAYRFGIALAVSPAEDMAAKGPIGSEFTIVDYSDADEEIRKGAEKLLGVKSRSLTGKGSAELDSVETKSPVADWQKSPQNKK